VWRGGASKKKRKRAELDAKTGRKKKKGKAYAFVGKKVKTNWGEEEGGKENFREPA